MIRPITKPEQVGGCHTYRAVGPPATRFEELGRLVAYLRERDPDHLSRINLFPSNSVTVDLPPGGGVLVGLTSAVP